MFLIQFDNPQELVVHTAMIGMHVIAMLAIIAAHNIGRHRLRSKFVKDLQVQGVILKKEPRIVTA